MNVETSALSIQNTDLVRKWAEHIRFILILEKFTLVPTQTSIFYWGSSRSQKGVSFSEGLKSGQSSKGYSDCFLTKPCVTAIVWRVLFGHLASLVDLVKNSRLHCRQLQ